MTIKKRLFWSNILMIAMPVISTMLIGCVCVGVIWLSLIGGMGLGINDQEDFDHACMAVSEMLEYDIGRDAGFSSVKALLDSNRMALKIVVGGETFFEYGNREDGDAALLSAAELLGGQPTLTLEERSLYVGSERVNGVDYTIYLFGNYHGRETYSELKVSLVLSAIVIAFTIFLSILLTNRFLTRFVFRRIEEPLDILAGGVHEIRDGNLDYRIVYGQADEFRPVCEDFNEMAVRLKQSVDRMQAQERSRRELVAGISHDLRSPLTSIQAYVEGLLDGVARTPESQKRYLETIKQKAEELAHIISQLFLFSKMELGEHPEDLQLLSLDEKIGETVSALQEEYESQGLEIHTKLVPAKIKADPVYLHRILMNILENSLKYKGERRGNLWICLEQMPDGCRLSFADDGPGVDPEALPHLFEVFYRSDPARQNPGKGSGLGLAIVANAVQRMGGHIHAIAAIERDYLEIEGFEVEIAADGRVGLERGLGGNFDLILLDLMLPGMDGFAVCRKLREKIKIPILMVTARQEDIDKIRGLGLGADDYIEKPFSPGVLVARVKANLAQYERILGVEKTPAEIVLGGIRLNTGTHRVFVEGREVELKNKEYELLLFFMLNVELVFDRETLYEKVWGLEAMGDNATVAVHINRLREKLEKDPSNPRYIETVWGAGYRFRG